MNSQQEIDLDATGTPLFPDMAGFVDHAGLESLPTDVCLRLLESVPVGRVSFYIGGEVVTLPVNHVIDGQDVVFRTDRGSKLSASEGRPSSRSKLTTTIPRPEPGGAS